jgi:hypothetical protein
VVFTPREAGEHRPGGHEWVDSAISGAIGLVAVAVLLGTAYGIWKEETSWTRRSGRSSTSGSARQHKQAR